MERLLESLEKAIAVKREHDLARDGCGSASWEYHGRIYIEAMAQAAGDFEKHLTAYIDTAIEAKIAAQLARV